MRKSRFSKEQILGFLRQAELGESVQNICRQGDFSDTTFYSWRAKYGQVSGTDLICCCELGVENGLLKKLLAEARSDIEVLKATFNVNQLTPDEKRKAILSILRKSGYLSELTESHLTELTRD
ncbi:transposase [Deefgea tanakiae]|uniref:Transposase n=1 Tax=Deefgea tanakiae TaxID=2865840 RepID=A0ABX8Z618_9NEIS|nr:transposase [Deefgea tanakiae]QZA76463.1 transposase [Deefgea tanakiae]